MKSRNRKLKREAQIHKDGAPELLCQKEAQQLQDKIVSGIHEFESSAIRLAIDLDKFIRGRGWVALGYGRMTDWREKEIPEAEFYYLRNVRRLLADGVPAEKIKAMKITNINTMARALPPEQWKNPEWQEAAAKMPTDKFFKKAHRSSDEIGWHVEVLERRGFQVSKSIAENWDVALRIAEAIDGANSMEHRVEAIVSNYLNSPSEIAFKNKLQAYEALKAEDTTETQLTQGQAG